MPHANTFALVTHWQLPARIEDVAAVLTDAEAFPRWWGSVYLETRITDPGDARGIGRKVWVRSKGRLPYQLVWTGCLVRANLPHGWEIDATGDLTGHGIWHLRQNGAMAEVTYDWRVSADKPILRRLSPLLAPVFAWNHRWAMARGLAGLKAELVRRGQLPSATPTTNRTA